MKSTMFDDALARSEIGDEIVYHRGFYCVMSGDRPKRNPEAQAAWAAYVRGDVLLYQRRMGQFDLQYCAKVIR